MAQATLNAGPVPENSRVVFTLIPQDETGTPTALDGELTAVNDQAQAPVIDATNPLSLKIRVDPTPDRTAVSVITGGDSDGDPSFIFEIDWDGKITVKKATQFGGVTAEFEPVA
jgi:hypothetical protein